MDLDFWPAETRQRSPSFLIDYYIYSATRDFHKKKKSDDIPARPASLYLFSILPCISFLYFIFALAHMQIAPFYSATVG